MECSKNDNLKNCPCTYEGCFKKGICCECIKSHLANREFPACCFSKTEEMSYDRSFNNFIKNYKG